MTSRDFCYWLQGFFEIVTTNAPTPAITPEQSEMIRRHLNLVFIHEIDPSIPDPTGKLQAIHDGVPLEEKSILSTLPVSTVSGPPYPPNKVPSSNFPFQPGQRC